MAIPISKIIAKPIKYIANIVDGTEKRKIVETIKVVYIIEEKGFTPLTDLRKDFLLYISLVEDLYYKAKKDLLEIELDIKKGEGLSSIDPKIRNMIEENINHYHSDLEFILNELKAMMSEAVKYHNIKQAEWNQKALYERTRRTKNYNEKLVVLSQKEITVYDDENSIINFDYQLNSKTYSYSGGSLTQKERAEIFLDINKFKMIISDLQLLALEYRNSQSNLDGVTNNLNNSIGVSCNGHKIDKNIILANYSFRTEKFVKDLLSLIINVGNEISRVNNGKYEYRIFAKNGQDYTIVILDREVGKEIEKITFEINDESEAIFPPGANDTSSSDNKNGGNEKRIISGAKIINNGSQSIVGTETFPTTGATPISTPTRSIDTGNDDNGDKGDTPLEPTKPVVDPTPVVPTEPVVDPTRPGGDDTTPIVEPTNPGGDNFTPGSSGEETPTTPSQRPEGHSGGSYTGTGGYNYYSPEDNNSKTDKEIKDITGNTKASIDDIVKGKKYTKIPTVSTPITSKTKTSGSGAVIPIAAGLSAAAAAGIGAKAYMDHKKNNDNDDDLYEDTYQDDFNADEWKNDTETIEIDDSEEQEEYLDENDEFGYTAKTSNYNENTSELSDIE